MKNLILGIVAVAAVTVAFAFKAPEAKLVDQQFTLDDINVPFDPQNYSPSALTEAQILAECPSAAKVCVIVVPATDVYTSGPNVGKPKVDIQTGATGELQDDIATALANASDPTTLNGRKIYERN